MPDIQNRLSELEIRLASSALHWKRQYDECCPDVGMGPTDSQLLSELEEEMGFNIHKKDKAEILKRVQNYGAEIHNHQTDI